ncbi:alkaline phosphatase D family protein [Pelagicoccus enzymogenes]|uniref:alkaline phosphatase D family protein n=1 Tax=Pelagicoccus enzymogenes TaxID=2773457 RepID=UPI00280D0567|nr:alkaline phosphatase D family protein [Pelagicoccus enzymogenes]MDQ8198064.1 alkaline phosphatase D family protein [Pelagicoccus enzymogenes]
MSIQSIRLALIASCATLSALSAVAAPKLMQGPMLGHVDQNSAQIWARVAGEANLSILYSESPSFTDARESAPVRALPQNDYCVQATIDGLEAGSFYYYQVLVDGEPLDAVREREGYPLLTAPPSDMEVQFTIAFGAGAKTEVDGMQAIWLQVQNARPHAFFWLGDNESAEGLEPAFQAEQYRKQRNIPFLQPLLRSIPQLATWDGPKKDSAKSFDVFQRYWANPSYGTDENRGSYFKYNYGGVDFFVLDTYSFRQSGEGATLLGNSQLEWLKAELDASAAPFKVLLSSSSWTDIKESSDSTWTAYAHERDDLLGYITQSDIPGVILVSGDNDQAEVKAIPMSRKGGYDFYELVSSPLAQDPVASYDEQEASTINIHEPYASTMNFGLLSFDMTGDDPSFAYDVINVMGESVFPTLEVKASELQNGVSSWQTKVDDPEAYADAGLAPVAPSNAVVQ